MRKRLKIFDDNILLKVLKIVVLSSSGILLLWFTFDITGLKLGSTRLVASAFIDEPIDFVFYLIFVGCIIFFILKDKIGKYLLFGFLLLWGGFQFTVYFKTGESITSYNNFFADTHHIIAPSQDTLIKDTYHIFLDIFIVLALAAVIAFLITTIVLNKKKSK